MERYLDRPALAAEIPSAAEYVRSTREIAAGPEVAQRGREAGQTLGADPAAAVAGGMRLADYLPTRTFEPAVHTADLAAALGEPVEVPRTAAAQAVQIVAELAIIDGRADRLLLAATGRPGAGDGFTVL